MRFIPIIC